MSETTKIDNPVSLIEKTDTMEKVDESNGHSNIRVDTDKKNSQAIKSKKSKKKKNVYLSLNQIFNYPLLNQNSVTWIDSTNFYFCNLCQCSIIGINEAYFHIAQNFHKKMLNEKPTKYKQRIQNDMDILNEHSQKFWCIKCEKSIDMDPTLIQCHCLFHLYENLPKSQQCIFQYCVIDKKRYLKCCLCDVMVDNDKILAEHLETPKHTQILDLLYSMNQNVKWNDFQHSRYKKEDVKLFNFNPKRHLEIKSQASTLDGSTDSSNNKLTDGATSDDSQCNKLQISTITEKLIAYCHFFVCLTCNKKMSCSKSMHQHCKSAKHMNVLNNIQLVINDTVDNFVRPLDYTKYFLRLSLHGNWKDRKKSAETKHLDKKSKNIAYQEDVKNFGNQYMSMCIDNENRSTKSIYKLDNKELHLLKLGVSLIYTFPSYRLCVPCAYKFAHPLKIAFEHLQNEEHLQNLDEMERNAESSQNTFHLMYLANSCIGLDPESDDYLRCFACETTIIDTDNDIDCHLKDPTHISKLKFVNDKKFVLQKVCNDIIVKEVWYHAERFFCDVCNVDYKREISFAGHLSQPGHLENVQKDKSKCKINICFACSTCWYGKPLYSEHCQKKVHGKFVNGFHLFLTDSVKKLCKFLDKRTDDLIRESRSLNPEKDLLLLRSLEARVGTVYPDVRAYSFGSRFSCLGSNSSDVDVFLDCENNYCEIGSQEKSKIYIKTVRNCLQKDKGIWKIERVLLKTRVPIIKLEHRPTRLKCDISFLNGLGVEKSKLIRNYVLADPICRRFMLFLKTWFQACRLYGSQGINGYAVTWFAIFYLQIEGYLPNVNQLIEKKNESIIDGWQCGYSDVSILKQATLRGVAFSNLIRGFFTFYAKKFNYREDVACPFLGKVMKKKSFVVLDKLPPEMGIYKERAKKIETEHFRYDSPLAIQDPVDLSQNITKAVTKTQLRQFRYSCLISCREVGTRK